jgi:hypothetical protein
MRIDEGVWSSHGIILKAWNWNTRKKTCTSANLSITNPTWTDPGWNHGLRYDRPTTNRLSHGKAMLEGNPAWLRVSFLRFLIWNFKNWAFGTSLFWKHLGATTNGQMLQCLIENTQTHMQNHSVETQNSVNPLLPGDSSWYCSRFSSVFPAKWYYRKPSSFHMLPNSQFIIALPFDTI